MDRSTESAGTVVVCPEPSQRTIDDYRAFIGDLTQLLLSHPGQFVAYVNREIIDIDESSFALEGLCAARGFGPLDYSIFFIEKQDNDPVAEPIDA